MPHSTPSSIDPNTLRRVIVAASIGNFVEWFDFAIYGFLATAIAEQFFPSGDSQVALLKTFAVFAVAFAFRPLGGIVFGMLGDKMGRKRTLSLTILIMAGATTLIGFLPNYATWGVAAPIVLALIRCVQGFSAGGEYAGACAYVMEHAPAGKRARYGSFLPVSTFSAFAFAAVIAFALEAMLSKEVMQTWDWRIPFIMAAPLGLIGIYLRLRLDETPAFQVLQEQHSEAHAPLRETVRTHAGMMCRLGGFIAVTALSFYTFTTYFSTYLQVAGNLSRAQSLLVSVLALVLAAILCPIAGRICDAIGRRKSIALVCGLLLVTTYPAFLLASTGSLLLALLGISLLVPSAVLSGVVTAVLLSELFPTRVRYTASAITYNMAYTIFGGTAPLLATYLIGQTGNKLAPAFYLMLIALCAWLAGRTLPETTHVDLADVV